MIRLVYLYIQSFSQVFSTVQTLLNQPYHLAGVMEETNLGEI